MRLFFSIAAISLLIGCNSGPKQDLTHLQGYWEIQSVQTPDGQEKEFGVNTLIDYFQIDGQTGSRSKMQPQLDGSYKKQPTTETFRVIDSAGYWYLQYRTPYDSWQERLKELDPDRLVLQIPAGNTYRYKRFEPIKLDD